MNEDVSPIEDGGFLLNMWDIPLLCFINFSPDVSMSCVGNRCYVSLPEGIWDYQVANNSSQSLQPRSLTSRL